MQRSLVYAILAALVWGASPLLEKIGLRKISPVYAVFIRSLAVTTTLFFYLIFKNGFKKTCFTDIKSVTFIILGGLLAGMVGQLFYFTSLKSWEASRVVPIAGSYPLVAFLLSVLLLGEQITLYKLAGVVLIIGGITLIKI